MEKKFKVVFYYEGMKRAIVTRGFSYSVYYILSDIFFIFLPIPVIR